MKVRQSGGLRLGHVRVQSQKFGRENGVANYQGIQLELERRYSERIAFQVFYNLNNSLVAGGTGYNASSIIPELNQFLPGTVPTDIEQRTRLYNYQRDITIPKHRLRWNWIADLPFGRGKPIGGNAGGTAQHVHRRLAGCGSRPVTEQLLQPAQPAHHRLADRERH